MLIHSCVVAGLGEQQMPFLDFLDLVMPDIKLLLPAAPHPVLALLLEPLLEPMDLLLQHVDPLSELGRCQLLLLVVA